MSDTPETNAAVADIPFPWDFHTEKLVRHAEQLERDRNQARGALELARKKLESR